MRILSSISTAMRSRVHSSHSEKDRLVGARDGLQRRVRKLLPKTHRKMMVTGGWRWGEAGGAKKAGTWLRLSLSQWLETTHVYYLTVLEAEVRNESDCTNTSVLAGLAAEAREKNVTPSSSGCRGLPTFPGLWSHCLLLSIVKSPSAFLLEGPS